MAEYGQVDTSIPLSAAKRTPMMERVGQFADTMNSINQNKLFIGKQAAGQAIQQSIDPATGQVNWESVNRLIRANPKIAPYAQEALTAALSQRGQDISNTTGQANLAETYAANIRKDIGSATDPTQALGAVIRGVATGRYPKEFAAGFIGGADVNALIKQAAVQSGDAAMMETQFGTPGAVETGGQNVAITTNRVTGERSMMGGDAAAIDKELTPEAKIARVPYVDEQNVPRTAPVSALVTDTGEPKEGGVTGPGGSLRTGVAPGVAEAAGTAGQANAQMAMALTQRASKVPDNKAILGNMDGLLDKFEPGPQSGFWKGLGQVAAEYNIKLPGAPPKDKVAAQEEFGKLAFNLAQSQFQALGGTGTDSKLDNTMHTSPSELMTRYGNKGIIALLKGNEDAIAAQNDAWQKWRGAGHGPETYDRFLNQWNKIYDPRVFQSQYMGAAGRKTMLDGMSSAEQKQFEKSYKTAVGLGWVEP